MQHCQIKQDFRVAKKALKFIKVRWGRGGGAGGADTCKAWVAQLVCDICRIGLDFDVGNSIYIVSNRFSIQGIRSVLYRFKFRYGRYACAYFKCENIIKTY